MTSTVPQATQARPLRENTDFTLMWIGAGISRFGSCVGLVAYPLLVLYHTGSAASAGLVGFAAALPNLIIQLPAGAYVDRWDRRKVLLGCDLVGLVAVVAVAVTIALGYFWLPLLMAAAFLEVAVGTFYDLAERAAVRTIVTPGQLPTAMSRNEARGSGIGLLGQPASGLLLTIASWLPFGFMAIANLVAVGCVVRVRRDLSVPARETVRRRLRTEIAEGVSWLWQRRFARFLVSLFAASNLVFQVLALTVMVIIRHDGGSPADIGAVQVLRGIGGLFGSLIEPRLHHRYRLRTILAMVTGTWVVLMPLIAVVRQPVLLALVLGGLSFSCGVLNVAAWVFQVENTPDEMQGRVNGTARWLGAGFNAAGALGCGYLLDAVGATWTAAGLSAVVTLIAGGVFFSRTARTEDQHRLTPRIAEV